MANPLGVFFSRLAPEEKRFIKKIGLFSVVLLIASGFAMFFYTNFKKEKAEQSEQSEQSEASMDSVAAALEMPPEPEVPEHIEEELPSENSQDLFADDFDGQAHLQLMRQNVKEYNYQMAYKHGLKIVGYLRDVPELAAEWGHILLEAGKPQDAVSVLQKTDAAVDLAFAMHRSGNTEDAIQFLDDKLKSSNDANLLTVKAAIIGEHPDTTKRAAAALIFKKVLKIKPLLPEANYQYGRFLMQKGDYQDSKVHLERALKVKPDEPRYIARLGMAEFYLKHDSNAESLYKKALKINPYDYNTWFNLGELYLSRANESSYSHEIQQKTQKAFEAYLKAIENDSLHTGAHYRIGLILNGNGGYKEAVKHLIMVLEKIPDDIPSMQQLSVAYAQLGDTAKSIDYLNKILQIDPFNKIAANEFNRIREQK